MSSGMRLKAKAGEKMLDIANYIFLTLFMIICIYPFYYVFIYSISNSAQAAHGIYLWPVQIDLISYSKLFERKDLGQAFLTSIERTIAGTGLTVFCSSLFAYLVTKKEMMFRRFSYRFVIVTMYVGAGLIPWYITMKAYGLKDNFLLYILPGSVSAFFIVLVKTFIEQLPASLEESAEIDGAGIFVRYAKIIMPLCMPIIATITVFAAVGAWNSWMDNYLLVRNPSLITLQLLLYNYLNEAQSIADSMKRGLLPVGGNTPPTITPESVRMAITMISIAPIMLVYPLLQRYFIKGIMIGAIKG